MTFAALMLAMSVTTACSEDDPILVDTETPMPPTDNGDENDTANSENPTTSEEDDDNNNENEDKNEMNKNITITVGGTSFAATLTDNDAARAFAAMLPMSIQMSELNGNEKYHYLDNNLPTDSYRLGTIHAGDLMLYGSTCVVLFYETFSSSYSYTRIGQVNNPQGLKEALGSGDANVKFEMATL